MQNPTTPMLLLVTAGCAEIIVHRAAHVSARPVRREGLHQVPRLVHFVVRGKLPVIEVGSERHEARGAEAIGHLLDAGIEAPPFLDDQDSGAGTSRGRDEIPGRDGAITGEFNGFSHARKDNRNSHRCDSRVRRRRAWPFQGVGARIPRPR